MQSRPNPSFNLVIQMMRCDNLMLDTVEEFISLVTPEFLPRLIFWFRAVDIAEMPTRLKLGIQKFHSLFASFRTVIKKQWQTNMSSIIHKVIGKHRINSAANCNVK
jgi:hypothetical protein